jgi:hypothetical protein
MGPMPVEENPSRLNLPTWPEFITLVFMQSAGRSGKSRSFIPQVSDRSKTSARRLERV